MKWIQVQRKSKVLPADITREHLQGTGLPVIITDATAKWPARSKWTFEFFKAAYGSDIATAWLGTGSRIGKLTTLSAYIDFLNRPSAELPGVWTGGDISKDNCALSKAGLPAFYLTGWFAFLLHPKLYDDIEPTPYFLRDWATALSPTLRDILEWTSDKKYSAIYIGPEGSLSPLHFDYWNTHAYLAQIQGRKRAILFSPKDTDFLYGGQVDPEQPDFDRFPLFDHATAYECVIEPGDTLLMPANWWHHVRGLEKTITVSRNFFNETNFTEHMNHILRNLPALVEGIHQSPNWRQELQIKWRAQDLTLQKSSRRG